MGKNDVVKTEASGFAPIGKCKTQEEYAALIHEGKGIVEQIEQATRTRDGLVLTKLYRLGSIILENIGDYETQTGETSVRQFVQDIGYSDGSKGSSDGYFAVQLARNYTDEQIKAMAAKGPTMSALREIMAVKDADARDKLIGKIVGDKRSTVREVRSEIAQLASSNPSAMTDSSNRRREAVKTAKQTKAEVGGPARVCGRIHALIEQVIEAAGDYCLIQEQISSLDDDGRNEVLAAVNEVDEMFVTLASTLDDLQKVSDKLIKACKQ